MLRCQLSVGALLIVVACTAALGAHGIDGRGAHPRVGPQDSVAYHVQMDPHFDPNSAFPWGEDTVSDDDQPFGIRKIRATPELIRRGTEGRQEKVGDQESESESDSESRRGGVGVSAILRLKGAASCYFSGVWHRVGVWFTNPLVGWRRGEDRWRIRSGQNFLSARVGPVRRAKLLEKGNPGGNPKLSERWTGDINNFLADRKLGRAKVSGSQLPLDVTVLESEIRKESLTQIELGDLACPLSECPRFAGCPQNFSARFRACENTKFSQTVMDSAKDPENCPDNRADKRVWNAVVHNPLCTHRQDAIQHAQYVARISVLENAYVSWSGQTFDSRYLYNQDGCSTSSHFNFSKGTPVSSFHELVNIAHRHGPAFYHGFVEFFPLFLVIANLMPHVKGIPVAQRIRQEGIHETVGQLLIGLSREQYNGYGVLKNELFFAHRVYVVAKDQNGYPDNWVVILGKRYGPRSLDQSDEVEEAMRAIFPPERLKIFDGDVGILDAKALFNRARLFVSPHGALCVNMAFMPFGGHLFEIRPREYPNACFHHLAEVCELHYYLVMGNGTFSSTIDVDVKPVVETLHMIKERMDREEEEMDS